MTFFKKNYVFIKIKLNYRTEYTVINNNTICLYNILQ